MVVNVLDLRQRRLFLQILHTRSHARRSLLGHTVSLLLHSIGLGLRLGQGIGALLIRVFPGILAIPDLGLVDERLLTLQTPVAGMEPAECLRVGVDLLAHPAKPCVVSFGFRGLDDRQALLRQRLRRLSVYGARG